MKYLHAATISATSMGFGWAAHVLAFDLTSSLARALAVGAAAGFGAIGAIHLMKNWGKLR